DTVMLRAYSKYLLQIRVPFSLAYMIETLVDHPRIVRSLVDLFHLRFDPRRAKSGAGRVSELVKQIEERIDSVASLDEDRILRGFLNAVLSTLRTNYFQKQNDGQ
ncbi:MAG: hypothetical protein GTO41_16705, partial [Burkholderiales bacterium]|nr:hypothetical protein [Burkholderiales bacterium]